jgi:hypothetical protein
VRLAAPMTCRTALSFNLHLIPTLERGNEDPAAVYKKYAIEPADPS